ncbi:MAG: NAD-dependent epimerase/dehydratase family protein [Micromonosporaceae bacterium]
MRILITGGAGFIGSHVVESLTTAGYGVRVLDCLHPAAHGDERRWPSYLDGVETVRGDLRDAAAVREAVRGVDAVVHQAAMVGLGVDAYDLPEYVACNDLGTAVLLAEMARTGVHRLVVASSMVVYGEGRYECPAHGAVRPGPRHVDDLSAGRFEPPCPRCGAPLRPGLVTEEAPLDPRNGYAASKVATEHLASSWVRITGGAAVGLRYHNVYGPRMPRDTPYSGVAAIFRSRLEAGEPPLVFEDGGQRRDFVHVRDVAAANLAALRATEATVAPGGNLAGAGGRFTTYNIASGQPRTVGEMAEALAGAFGGPRPVVTGDYRLGDVRHVVASPQRAADELGFRAQVSFGDGMREFATVPLRA